MDRKYHEGSSVNYIRRPLRIYTEGEGVASTKATKGLDPIARIEVKSNPHGNLISNGVIEAEREALSILEKETSNYGNIAVVINRHLMGLISSTLILSADIYDTRP